MCVCGERPLTLSRRYALERPYWEAVQLFKKLLLVCASSTFITAAPSQAAAGAAINLVYLALLETKKPMPYRPSTSAWFKNQNFFHLVERSSASTSLAGSLLAILGAVSRSLVDVFGTIFAIMNIAYVSERSEREEERRTASGSGSPPTFFFLCERSGGEERAGTRTT